MERRGHTARTHRCAQRRVTCDTRLKPQGPALNLFHQGLAGQPPLPIGTVDGGFVTAAALQALRGRLEEAAARSRAWQSSLHPKLSVHSRVRLRNPHLGIGPGRTMWDMLLPFCVFFGCVGSLLLSVSAFPQLWYAHFSWPWLLLLWSTGCRCMGSLLAVHRLQGFQ